MIEFEFEFQYAEEKQPTLQKVGGSIPAGRCVVLCGGSGCGKSTLLRCINGLIPQFYEGELRGFCRLNGQDTAGMSIGEIGDEAGLMPCIIELAKAKRAYEKIRSAMEQVEATGYGIVMPSIDELSLEQPEIVRQGGRYGVRLEASAPSIHMMKAVIHTELSPIVGTEKQSEDLVQSLLKDFEDDPVRLWESNIFGKSLHELVNDGLQNKLLHMPQEARGRLQETLERVINEGCTGLICILI